MASVVSLCPHRSILSYIPPFQTLCFLSGLHWPGPPSTGSHNSLELSSGTMSQNYVESYVSYLGVSSPASHGHKAGKSCLWFTVTSPEPSWSSMHAWKTVGTGRHSIVPEGVMQDGCHLVKINMQMNNQPILVSPPLGALPVFSPALRLDHLEFGTFISTQGLVFSLRMRWAIFLPWFSGLWTQFDSTKSKTEIPGRREAPLKKIIPLYRISTEIFYFFPSNILHVTFLKLLYRIPYSESISFLSCRKTLDRWGEGRGQNVTALKSASTLAHSCRMSGDTTHACTWGRIKHLLTGDGNSGKGAAFAAVNPCHPWGWPSPFSHREVIGGIIGYTK